MTSKIAGILILVFFMLVAWILSMTANMEGAELGALFNLILPPFFGVISLLLYLLVCSVTKDNLPRIFVIIASSLYLLYVGLNFKLNPGNLPIPF
jgi:hypothetical protein